VPANTFYLKPVRVPGGTGNLWGITRSATQSPESAGLWGFLAFKTNNSFCATTAGQLYQSGVDEQLVVERTGHRSLHGVTFGQAHLR
jgi:hypothetical protein